jgi:hypothetical protein
MSHYILMELLIHQFIKDHELSTKTTLLEIVIVICYTSIQTLGLFFC